MKIRHVTEKGLTKKFREFLKKEGALEQYLHNFNHDPARGIRTHELRKDSYFFIVRAFVWEGTPEGVAFWSKLHHAWQDIY